MYAIKIRLNEDIKQAMRARDKKLLNALRLISAAIKQIEVDERIEVNDERLLLILEKLAKQRKESIALFEEANRVDLLAQEQFELEIVIRYLPEPLSQEAILNFIQLAIDETSASKMSDMGKVMAIIKPAIIGRADMAMVSRLIKERLS